MTLCADRARQKLKRAERIPVIADVSLLKTNYTGNAEQQKQTAWLHYLLANVIEKHCREVPCGIVYSISLFLTPLLEVHADQLHLNEFVAFENQEMNLHLDFAVLGKKVNH